MATGLRYTLMQLPGIAFAGVVLMGVTHLGWLSEALAWWLFGFWILKDAAFYPLVGPALRRPPHLGPERMIGERAVVVRALDPTGTVRIGGELWRAQTARRADCPIEPGSDVRVESVQDLTLGVRRIDAVDGED